MNTTLPTAPAATDQPAGELQATPHNVLFSLAYGKKVTCWYVRSADQPLYSHETLLAEQVPPSAFFAFTYHLSAYQVRPVSVQDARKLWEVFDALYQQDPESFEGKWQFLCQHYRR